MRKTNQPEKSANCSVSKPSHNFRKELLVLGNTGFQPLSCRSFPATHLPTILESPNRLLVEILLPRMMRLGGFWFGRSFSWLFLGLEPVGVEDTGFIDAFVSVRTEEIALRLQEIRWKAS
jgi:hypothetical protein